MTPGDSGVPGVEAVRMLDTEIEGNVGRVVSHERLTTMLARGQLFRFRGRKLVMTDAQEAGSSESVRYLLWLDPGLLPDQPDGESLLATLRSSGVRRVWVRHSADQIPGQGLAVCDGVLYLDAPIRQPPPSALVQSGRLRIRPPEGSADRRFVAELLKQALDLGCAEVGAQPDGVIDADLLTVAERPVEAHVAVLDGVRVGHASWWGDCEDELTGERFTELIDISVVPEAQGTGVTLALTGAVAAAAQQSRQPLVGSVVCQRDGGHTPVLSQLLVHGWRIRFGLTVHEVRADLVAPVPGTGNVQ